MCKCGCNTCETKGPLLTEGKVKSLLSEGLQYHIDKKIPLFETVYRIGSDKHLALIKEARKMYSRNVIDLCEDDEALIKTHLGEFALYEGVSVPLDLPMLNEAYYEVVANLGDKKTKENLDSFEEVQDFMNKMIKRNAISVDVTKFDKDKKQSIKYNWTGDKWEKVSKSDINESELDESKYENEESIQQTIDRLKARIDDPNDGGNVPFLVQKIKDLEKSLNEDEQLDEKKKAKKKEKKDPPLNKPKRGGSKAYYVYVRDPKTKKIKKVSFGSGGLRAKIRNPKARKAFAARHNCKNKKDRTKAGYWSCNLPRYAEQLGLGSKMNTFW